VIPPSRLASARPARHWPIAAGRRPGRLGAVPLVHAYLFQSLWLSWGAYWYASSLSASAPKRAQRPGARLFYRGELLLALALFTFPQLGVGWLGLQLVPRTEALFVSGALMLVAGLSFTVWARVHLGQHWSGHVTLKAGHRLIRTGPYALVRHPIYTGILLAMLGTAVAVDEVRGVLALLVALQAHVRKLRIEERWLTEEFGDEYRRYRREVKALIPGVV
jgi:protein-S-isoprenylcysteine O-methyltransferase Ste14